MSKKLFILFASVAMLASCSDKIYEEINTDPTKADKVNASAQLTFAELQLFGDMNYVDVHRLYTYALTQQLMGCWNTTNYWNKIDQVYLQRNGCPDEKTAPTCAGRSGRLVLPVAIVS